MNESIISKMKKVGLQLEFHKVLISILLGLIGFFGSPYSLNFINPPFTISIEWCDALPILAGMAFGGRYAFIAAILGSGAFYPFILYANNGWGNIVTVILLVSTYSAIGTFTGVRRRKPAFWNHPLIIYPLISLIYNFLFRLLFPWAFSLNPPFWNPAADTSIPIPILNSILVKSFIILIALTFFDAYLLKLPFVRKLFSLQIGKESRNNGWIFGGTLLGSFLLWVVLIIFNRIFIDQTFPQRVFQVGDPRESLALLVFITAGLTAGFIICQYMESRLEAENEAEKSHQSYRLIFEQAADGIFIADPQGRYVDVNESGCRLTGYTRQEILNLGMSDLVMPEETGDVPARLSELNAGENIVFERCMCHKNGSSIPVEISARKLADGRLQGLVRDSTQRKAAEEKARAAQAELKQMLKTADESRMALLSLVEDQKEAEEQILRLNAELEQRVAERTAQLTAANQELEAFTYSVSHDLRAPLRSLDGFSAILMSDYNGQLDDGGRLYLARIQESVHRMAKLINNLLNLSRVSRTELTYQQVDLSVLVQNICAELQTLSPQRRVQLDISAGLIVAGDTDLLKIALENLLSNAFKFTSQCEQAVIQVGMLEQAGEKVYWIRDNGTGFDMAWADKLFIPFQRLHNAREFPGTGIGLSIVQRIITRHGGRIWPESEIGKGTTFYFTLRDSG